MILYPENGNITAPLVNNPPTLTDGDVSPSSGTPYTTLTYSVNYTDADNSQPAYVRVIIDGVPHDMIKRASIEPDYENGSIYKYSTNLALGGHDFYFNASDGIESVRFPVSGNITGPTVGLGANNAPNLVGGGFWPATGDNNTIFIFWVNFTDADCNSPTDIRVSIDGNNYSMIKFEPVILGYGQDSFPADSFFDVFYEYPCDPEELPCPSLYVFFTNLSLGSHTYYYTASDGTNQTRFPSSGEKKGPTVAEGGIPSFGIFMILFGVSDAVMISIILIRKRKAIPL
jgi:hypothetical protein